MSGNIIVNVHVRIEPLPERLSGNGMRQFQGSL